MYRATAKAAVIETMSDSCEVKKFGCLNSLLKLTFQKLIEDVLTKKIKENKDTFILARYMFTDAKSVKVNFDVISCRACRKMKTTKIRFQMDITNMFTAGSISILGISNIKIKDTNLVLIFQDIEFESEHFAVKGIMASVRQYVKQFVKQGEATDMDIFRWLVGKDEIILYQSVS